MTLEAQETPGNISPQSLTDPKSVADLEDIFSLGYATSDPVVLFEDEDKGIYIEVVYRTLTPLELKDVFDEVAKSVSSFGQRITERIETLARAIQTVNKSPLVLSAADQEHYCKKFEVDSMTPLDQARVILRTKIKSVEVIEMLWKKYQEFKENVVKDIEDIKKK